MDRFRVALPFAEKSIDNLCDTSSIISSNSRTSQALVGQGQKLFPEKSEEFFALQVHFIKNCKTLLKS
jgi:hypothetical protein